jgi:hypothetical protein
MAEDGEKHEDDASVTGKGLIGGAAATILAIGAGFLRHADDVIRPVARHADDFARPVVRQVDELARPMGRHADGFAEPMADHGDDIGRILGRGDASGAEALRGAEAVRGAEHGGHDVDLDALIRSLSKGTDRALRRRSQEGAGMNPPVAEADEPPAIPAEEEAAEDGRPAVDPTPPVATETQAPE